MSEITTKTIFTVKNFTFVFAMCMSLVAFALSFTAVKGLSMRHGIDLPDLIPVMIDGLIVLALVWRFTDTDVLWAQVVMFCYMAVSIALNFGAHWPDYIAGLIASLAPITLFITSEICMRICKSGKKLEIVIGKPINVPMRDARGRFVKKEV